MARPEVHRRVKSYSAESGVTYQYCFYEVEKTTRKKISGSGSGGVTVYTYLVSTDRKTSFPLHVYVWQEAVGNWEKGVGRRMTGTEEYALAKLRLFRGFDEAQEPLAPAAELFVDDSNLDGLLSQLDL